MIKNINCPVSKSPPRFFQQPVDIAHSKTHMLKSAPQRAIWRCQKLSSSYRQSFGKTLLAFLKHLFEPYPRFLEQFSNHIKEALCTPHKHIKKKFVIPFMMSSNIRPPRLIQININKFICLIYF